MKIKLLDYIPLSNAVIGGRTAWQSFHKGGNYTYSTDSITEEDFNFLKRLFNKFKHQSVAEHIWYTFEIMTDNFNEKEEIYLAKNEYSFFSKEDENKFIFSVNLRTFYEFKNHNFYKKLLEYLPNSFLQLLEAFSLLR